MVQNTYQKDSYLSLKYLKGESLELRNQPIYTSLSPKCLVLESVGLRLEAQVCGTACQKAYESAGLWKGAKN